MRFKYEITISRLLFSPFMTFQSKLQKHLFIVIDEGQIFQGFIGILQYLMTGKFFEFKCLLNNISDIERSQWIKRTDDAWGFLKILNVHVYNTQYSSLRMPIILFCLRIIIMQDRAAVMGVEKYIFTVNFWREIEALKSLVL